MVSVPVAYTDPAHFSPVISTHSSQNATELTMRSVATMPCFVSGFLLVFCLISSLRFGAGDEALGVNLQCDAFSQCSRDPASLLLNVNEQAQKWPHTMSFEDMMTKVKTADGFLAALDQSGGSTPNALRIYGIPDSVGESDVGMMWVPIAL